MYRQSLSLVFLLFGEGPFLCSCLVQKMQAAKPVSASLASGSGSAGQLVRIRSELPTTFYQALGLRRLGCPPKNATATAVGAREPNTEVL